MISLEKHQLNKCMILLSADGDCRLIAIVVVALAVITTLVKSTLDVLGKVLDSFDLHGNHQHMLANSVTKWRHTLSPAHRVASSGMSSTSCTFTTIIIISRCFLSRVSRIEAHLIPSPSSGVFWNVLNFLHLDKNHQ